ncbi:hypothetical protein L0244_37415, partial [bacterium]|nr:hypothetical protein [bacterium]
SLFYLLSRRYKGDWIWPDIARTGRYWQLIFFHLLLSIVFFVWIIHAKLDQIIYAIFLWPLAGTVLTYLNLRRVHPVTDWKGWLPFGLTCSILALVVVFTLNESESARLFCVGLIGACTLLFSPWNPWVLEKAGLLGYRAGFVFIIVSFLTLVSILPALAFFKIAYDIDMELLVKHGQLHFAKALEKREARVKDDYQEVTISNSDEFLRRRLALNSALDIHQDLFFDMRTDSCSCALSSMEHGSKKPSLEQKFKEKLLNFMPLYTGITIEMRELIHERAADNSWQWTSSRTNNRFLLLHKKGYLQNHQRHISSLLPIWQVHQSVWWSLGLLITILLILYLVARFIAKRFFLYDLQEPSDAEPADFDLGKIRQNLLLLGPPASGKSALFRDKDNFHLIDLATFENAEKLTAMAKCESVPQEKIIVIDHFEYNLGDPNWKSKKLDLLEELIYTRKRTVVVISTFDPLHFFSTDTVDAEQHKQNGHHASQKEPWAIVLSSFIKIHFQDLGNPVTFEATIAQAEKKLLSNVNKRTRKQLHRLLQTLREECSHSLRLQAIGEAIVKLPDFGKFSREELINQVRDQADAYYYALWSSCSKEEKIVLYYLAQDGLVNPNSPPIVRGLLRDRLV